MGPDPGGTQPTPPPLPPPPRAPSTPSVAAEPAWRGDLPTAVLRASFARLFLLQALWNYERMQGIGLAYALVPVVRRLEPDDAAAARSLAPQTAYFNTHPVMASVAVGVVAQQFERRARGAGALDDAGLARVRQAIGASLAAAGDPLFWFSVRPLVAVAGVYAWREDRTWLGAVTLFAGYNLIAVGFRYRGLLEGYRRGLAYVAQLPARLGRLTEVVRALGVVLCALLCATILVPSGGGSPRHVLGGLAGIVSGALLFGGARLGPGEWGLVLVLGALAWATVGPGF